MTQVDSRAGRQPGPLDVRLLVTPGVADEGRFFSGRTDEGCERHAQVGPTWEATRVEQDVQLSGVTAIARCGGGSMRTGVHGNRDQHRLSVADAARFRRPL